MVSPPSGGNASPPHRWPRRLTALLLIALAHRLAIVVWTSTIATDSAYYLWSARWFGEGAWSRALANIERLHPLYPAAISLVAHVTGDETAAGYLISVLAGTLAMIPLFFLVRGAWNETVALWACLIYALHPILALETSEVLSEGLFIALLIASVAIFSSARRRQATWPCGAAGIVAGLAYLTRPAAIAVPLWGVLCAGADWVRRRRPGAADPAGRADARRGLAGAGLLLLGFSLVGAPYLVWIHHAEGGWTLSPRGNVKRILQTLVQTWVAPDATEEAGEEGGGSAKKGSASLSLSRPFPDGPSAPDGPTPSVWAAVKKWIKSQYGPLIAFWAFGLWATRRWGGRWEALAPLIVLSLLIWIPAGLVEWLNPHTSHRYFLPGMLFTLPWSAAACAGLTAEAGRWRAGGARWAAVAVALLLAGLSLPRSLKPRRSEEAAFPEAGRWIREHRDPSRPCLLTASEKLAYYAGAPMARWPDTASAYDADKAYRDSHAGFFVLDDVRLDRHPGYREALDSAGYACAATFPASGDGGVTPVRVFRRRTRFPPDADLIPDRLLHWWNGPNTLDVDQLERAALALHPLGQRGTYRVERSRTGEAHVLKFIFVRPDPRETAVLQVGCALDLDTATPPSLRWEAEVCTPDGRGDGVTLFVQDRVGEAWERTTVPAEGNGWRSATVTRTLRKGAGGISVGIHFAPRAEGDWFELRNPRCRTGETTDPRRAE